MRYFDLLSDQMGQESQICTPNENYLKYEVQIKRRVKWKQISKAIHFISLFIDIYLSQK